MSKSKTKTSIHYKRDYDPDEPFGQVTFMLQQARGVKSNIPVGVVKTKSIEFLFSKFIDKLNEVKNVLTVDWNGKCCFRELQQVLGGQPLEEFKKIMRNHFPDDTDKTEDNYITCHQMIANGLYGQPLPGDHLKLYIQTHLKHSLCFTKEGVRKRPDDFLARINKMVDVGNRLYHNAAGDKLFTEQEFKLMFWSRFKDSKQSWLTDDQNMNPYGPDSAFGPNKIAEQMLRHWRLHL